VVDLARDEELIGYLPLPAEAASAIFQVVSRRVEHGSIIVTSNRGIASWGEIFSDSMMAAAIRDRFLYRATLLSITGNSSRMRAHRERLQQLREGWERPSRGRLRGLGGGGFR
jgi:DNA replication protein DnaC